MNFKKKLKLRFYMALMYLVIGLSIMLIGYYKEIGDASSFGLCFALVGIARLRRLKLINKNEESLRRYEIAENDERNIKIWTKARAFALVIYIYVSAVAIISLYILNMAKYAEIVSYNLIALVAIYWICYFAIKRKL